jgi:hypothetical protein
MNITKRQEQIDHHMFSHSYTTDSSKHMVARPEQHGILSAKTLLYTTALFVSLYHVAAYEHLVQFLIMFLIM